jgi:hypothetical protein
MTRIIRSAAVVLVVAGAIWAAFAAPASAEPLGSCPSGGGWQLIWSPETSPLPPPYTWGPAATRVDEQGNNDGYACKTVFTADGMVVGQVIDNRIQAGS